MDLAKRGWLTTSVALAVCSLLAQPVSPSFDIILRRGTVIDGTGLPRYRADVAIAGAFVARVGDLSKERATAEVDVTGLFVAPGFINIHSHASPGALPRAENMVTQGVTTEILNPATNTTRWTSTEFGVLQTADNWASFTARVRGLNGGPERSALVIVEQEDPFVEGNPATVTISIDGADSISGRLPPAAVDIRTAAPAAPARRRE